MRLGLLFALLISTLSANPKGKTVRAGSVTFKETEGVLSIAQESSSAIIHWDDFSIAQGETTEFILPSKETSVLNRVVGEMRSTIDGTLKSNGRVFLINPNGVLIGPNGLIQTQGLLISTLNLSDQEYLGGGDCILSGSSSASIVNRGAIETQDGELFLIAREVHNEGSYKAEDGIASIAASSEVFLCKKGDERIWVRSGIGTLENSGTIEAMQVELKAAGGNAYSLAINQNGIVQAKGIAEHNGKVILFANSGNIEVTGAIASSDAEFKQGGEIQVLGEAIALLKGAELDASGDFSGGKILVGGDYQGKNPSIRNALSVYVEEGSTARADARVQGNGGTLIFFAEKQNFFLGKASAQGGRLGGDGGLIEISSPGLLRHLGKVSTLAPFGNTGTFLLDPSSIVISDFRGKSVPFFKTSSDGVYDPEFPAALLDIADIQKALETNHVSIVTASGKEGVGTVKMDVDLTWSAPTTLRILADRDIWFKGVHISNTHASTTGSPWTAMDFQANQGEMSLEGDFTGIFAEGSSFSSIEGGISFKGRGGSENDNHGILLSSSSLLSSGEGTHAAPLTLSGVSGDGQDRCMGVMVASGGSLVATDGAISIQGTSMGTRTYNYGCCLTESSEVRSKGSSHIDLVGSSEAGSSRSIGFVMDGAKLISEKGGIAIRALSEGDTDHNPGMQMLAHSEISSSSPTCALTIQATGGIGQKQCHGIEMDGGVIRTESGKINIRATARGIEEPNHGICMVRSSRIETLSRTQGGDIEILAKGGNGFGIYADPYSKISTDFGMVHLIGGFHSETFEQ